MVGQEEVEKLERFFHEKRRDKLGGPGALT